MGAGLGLAATPAFEAAGVDFVLTASTLEGAATFLAGTALAAGLTGFGGVLAWAAAFAGTGRAAALLVALGKGLADVAGVGFLVTVLFVFAATATFTLAGALTGALDLTDAFALTGAALALTAGFTAALALTGAFTGALAFTATAFLTGVAGFLALAAVLDGATLAAAFLGVFTSCLLAVLKGIPGSECAQCAAVTQRVHRKQTHVIDLVGFARPSKEGAVRAAIVATRQLKKRRGSD